MITAMEIRNQQFKKSLRGFDEDEVKNFLFILAQDYENLYSENAQYKEKVQILQQDLEKYKNIEEIMNSSLILAQQTAEEVKVNAHKEAQIILEESKKRIANMMMVYQEIIKRLNIFNTELKSQLGVQLEMLDKNQRKVDDMSNFFYAKDLKDLLEELNKLTLKDNE